MDIEEFIKQVQPRKKRSRLLPFAGQIKLLKEQGYTDLQVRDWLAANGVEVSREAVRKFIKKAPDTSTPAAATPPGPAGEQDPARKDSPAEPGTPSQADKMRQKLKEQQKDADSKLFKHDKTGKT